MKKIKIIAAWEGRAQTITQYVTILHDLVTD